MGSPRFALGLDFGTESGRVLLVDTATGEEAACAVHRYGDGVIDERLPGSGTELEPDWALQNPSDYIAVLQNAIPEALKSAGVTAEQVVGIGVDFTSCTILPTTSEGIPLSDIDAWRNHPHAWTKLWKHHAAQPEADRITTCAAERGESWLERYGGRISSEWLHSKVLQMVDEAPEVYAAADRIIEAGDWLVWRMTGREQRNACAAGYKALWQKGTGYPGNDFLRALDPRLDGMNETKLGAPILPPGRLAGTLTAEAAAIAGLPVGLPVATATIDAHASVPGVGVAESGRMVLIMGTSTCHMLLGETGPLVGGISGVVEDGILPGLFGYEAGQAGVGDIFEWFVEHGTPPEYHSRAAELGVSVYTLLEEEAARLLPGESGLLALDWWNGNRSVLVDASLGGMIVGMTLGTRAPDIYRALIEATAFGTGIIIEAFEGHGVAVRELVACGGLAANNRLLMQIYADVTGREFRDTGSAQTSALGAAMFGAVAAGPEKGGYATIGEAAAAMSARSGSIYRPDPERHAMYRPLFDEYRRLHDYFGRGGNNVMKRLREMRAAVRS